MDILYYFTHNIINEEQKMFNFVVLIIVIAGSLNWLAIGAFQFDVIAGIFGSQSVFISRFLYTLIGLAGVWFLLLVAIKKGQINLRKQKNDANNKEKLNNNDKKEINKKDKKLMKNNKTNNLANEKQE